MSDSEQHNDKRDDLIAAYRKYVDHLVGMLMRAMHLSRDIREELTAAGYLGLVEAAERFDQSSGIEFKKFAFLRIRGAVIDAIRRNSDLSTRAYKYAKALQAVNDLRESTPISDHGISADCRLGPEFTLGRIMEYAAQGALAFRLSLNDAEEEVDLRSQLDENPEKKLIASQENSKLREIVRKLPAKERLIVEEYYFKGRSFVQIAADNLGMSKSWVSRLHSRAMVKLKEQYVKAIQS